MDLPNGVLDLAERVFAFATNIKPPSQDTWRKLLEMQVCCAGV